MGLSILVPLYIVFTWFQHGYHLDRVVYISESPIKFLMYIHLYLVVIMTGIEPTHTLFGQDLTHIIN